MGERLGWCLFAKALVLEVVGKNMKSAISARAGHTDARRDRGRPPKFDRDVALRQAMKLFWEHGFEGISTDDLEATLKIGPSSILNSFGSKEQLHALAIETYMGKPTKYFVDMLNSSPEIYAEIPHRPASSLRGMAVRLDRPRSRRAAQHAVDPGGAGKHAPARQG